MPFPLPDSIFGMNRAPLRASAFETLTALHSELLVAYTTANQFVY